jgi:antitoxin (DNA-binding transcriptional repressor) of toxin-antitoxin stability system
MVAVGLRELKARLSEYVRKAKGGETVLVTDRGQVVAEIRAPTTQLPDPVNDTLEELARRGVLRRGRANSPELYERAELSLAAGTSSAILRWLRGEGELAAAGGRSAARSARREAAEPRRARSGATNDRSGR